MIPELGDPEEFPTFRLIPDNPVELTIVSKGLVVTG